MSGHRPKEKERERDSKPRRRLRFRAPGEPGILIRKRAGFPREVLARVKERPAAAPRNRQIARIAIDRF